MPAEVATTGELSEEVDAARTAQARDDGVPAEVATTGELSEELDAARTAQARDDGVPAEVVTTAGGRASGDRYVALVPGHRGAPQLSEEVDDTLTAHARDDGVPAEVATTGELSEEVDDTLTAHARDDGVPAEVITTAGGRASGDRHLALVPGHRGAPRGAKPRLPNYVWTALILAAAGSGLLLQLRQPLDSSETRSAAISDQPATAIASEPSVPEVPRLAASEPEPKERASKAPAGKPSGSATAIASEPSVPEVPRLAASEPEPKERASKAPAGKPSGSAVASGRAPARKVAAPRAAPALPQANTATSVPAPAPKIQASVAAPATEPLAKTATLVFDVSPWGAIYIDGKPQGTTPPVKTLDVPPGTHRIEVRNSAQLPYLSSQTLQPGDVRRIRHNFQ